MMVLSIVWIKMILVLVHTIFMVEFVHLIYIDKNKNDETINMVIPMKTPVVISTSRKREKTIPTPRI